MIEQIGPSLLIVGALMLASAFFSGSETAIFSLQAIDRERLREQGGKRVLQLLADPRRTLASILMGNELVNISLSTVCAGVVLSIWPDKAWLNLLVATPLLIFFGEVVPKTIALRNSRAFASAVARPLTLWATLVTPFRWLLQSVANLAIRVFGASDDQGPRVLEEEQVRKLIDEGHQAGTIKSVEHELIHRVFSFGDVQVSRLMTPSPDLVSFPLNLPYARLVTRLEAHPYSRVPIYEGLPDNIIGILLTKDLLRYKTQQAPSPNELRRLLQQPYFVPGSKPADEMLREFQSLRMHMALVVDEHGSIDGVITLDNLLDELLGPQLDVDEDPEISRVSENHWSVVGGMDLDDLAQQTGIEFPDENATTVGGFLMDQLGHMPEMGEAVHYEGYRLRVLRMDGRRIVEVEIRKGVAP